MAQTLICDLCSAEAASMLQTMIDTGQNIAVGAACMGAFVAGQFEAFHGPHPAPGDGDTGDGSGQPPPPPAATAAAKPPRKRQAQRTPPGPRPVKDAAT